METFKLIVRRNTPRQNRVHRDLFESDEYRPRREKRKDDYKRRDKHRNKAYEY